MHDERRTSRVEFDDGSRSDADDGDGHVERFVQHVSPASGGDVDVDASFLIPCIF